MTRRVLTIGLIPVRLMDWLLRRIFGEPLAAEAKALRDATERMEEMRRQVDRSHR